MVGFLFRCFPVGFLVYSLVVEDCVFGPLNVIKPSMEVEVPF